MIPSNREAKIARIVFLSLLDPPGQPGRPEVIDYDKDRAEIRWAPPMSDGGNPIQKYVVEKRERGKEWEKVGKNV